MCYQKVILPGIGFTSGQNNRQMDS